MDETCTTPRSQRKEVLEGLCRKLRSPVFYSQHFDVDAADLFESASRLNLDHLETERRAVSLWSHRELG